MKYLIILMLLLGGITVSASAQHVVQAEDYTLVIDSASSLQIKAKPAEIERLKAYIETILSGFRPYSPLQMQEYHQNNLQDIPSQESSYSYSGREINEMILRILEERHNKEMYPDS